MAEKRDFYEVLGVKKGASEDELKKHTESLPRKITPTCIPATRNARLASRR